MRPLLVLLPFVLSLSACSTDSRTARTSTTAVTVDTLGDTIVVRTAGDIPPSEELTLVEVWRVGDRDGNETTSFGRVHSVAVTNTDEVVLFESSAPQLRWYAADGTLRQVIGGKGSGPGEYTRANGVAVLSDGRMVLWDGGNSRLNVYAPDGAFLTQLVAPVTGYSTSNSSLFALTNGGLGVEGYVRDSSLTREAIGRAAWFLYDSALVLRDTVVQTNNSDAPDNLIARVGGNTSTRSVPFIATPSAALHPAGFVLGSPGATYTVNSRQGSRPLRIERTVTAVPIDDQERSQTRERTTYGMRQTDPAWRWNGPEIPSHKAAITGLRSTMDGRVLVSVATASVPYEPEIPRVAEGETPPPVVYFRAPTAYELFDLDGQLRGKFTLPMGARLHAIRGSDAWGTVVDEDDVPYLVRWRLEGAGTAR